MSQSLEKPGNNSSIEENTKQIIELPKSKSLPVVENAKKKTEGVKLEVISNKDFLTTYPKTSDRFHRLTSPSMDENDIVNGSKINITFTHNGVFNRELYLNTTAGQCLPTKIRSVEVKGEKFTRLHNSMSGEFYTPGNKRLTIHEDTKIQVIECISQEELTKLETVETKLQGLEKEIYTAAIRKGIDPDMLKIIAMNRIMDINNSAKREIELELCITEVSRRLSRESFQKGKKYSLHLSAKILKSTSPDSWNTKLSTYGYGESKVAEYTKNSSFGTNLFVLGSLSATYESGNMGSYAYNPDDNGSPSYGTYQLHADAFNTFCKQNKIVPANRTGWNAKIVEVGLSEFQSREHNFIKETHFDRMMNQIKPEYASRFSIVLQNVIWSTSVQHGAYHKNLIKVINNFDFTPGNIESEKALVQAIYNERERVYPKGKPRYDKERKDAINQLTDNSSEGAMVS